jgi:hypothetical protein
MKILFFLLALANVALFMWEFHNGAVFSETQSSPDNVTENQESILLMSEVGNTSIASQPEMAPKLPNGNLTSNNKIDEKSVNEQSRPEKDMGLDSAVPALSAVPAIPSQSPTVLTGLTSETCFELGPFPNEQTYKAWESRLQGSMKRFNKEEQKIKDYLVYYPASATMAESESNLKMLKAKGVKELWLLRQGAEQGQISLGIFDKEEKALSLKNQMAVEGIAAEVKPRYQVKAQLFAVSKGQSNLGETLDLLKKTNPDINVKSLAGDSKGCL